MAGFYHFLPDIQLQELAPNKTLSRGVLKRFGLDDVLRDCSVVPDHVVVTEVPHGPDGKSGLCLYPKSIAGSDPPGWSYRPDHQEWIQFGGRYLGWEKASPPTPADLCRRSEIKDYVVFDKRGREWNVPCARSANPSGSSLPVEYAFGDDGEVLKHRPPDFEYLWKLSGDVLDALRGVAERGELWFVESALTVLQVNYRLGPAEVTAMQRMGQALLSNATVGSILSAFIDNDLEQEALEQKKTPTPELSEEGSAAS